MDTTKVEIPVVYILGKDARLKEATFYLEIPDEIEGKAKKEAYRLVKYRLQYFADNNDIDLIEVRAQERRFQESVECREQADYLNQSISDLLNEITVFIEKSIERKKYEEWSTVVN